MNRSERLDDHQRFKELAALAQGETLNESERLDLKRHMEGCVSCRQAYDEYVLLSTKGMDFLAAAYGRTHELPIWNDRQVRNRLLARVREAAPTPSVNRGAEVLRMGRTFFPRKAVAQWAVAALAACLLVTVAVGSYRLGGRASVTENHSPAASVYLQDTSFDQNATKERIASQNSELSRLEHQLTIGQDQVSKLREALRAAESHSAALLASNNARDQQFRRVTEERDSLASQLRDAEQSYRLVESELTNLRAEHDRALLRTTSLESKIEELNALNRDQDRRLKDDEQYLASDRDIRELMGARKLYIADVFDVDSGSRTRKPFGRVFYTQSKSLIFYAFDLDRQPGVKNASAFQVWGKRDTESGDKNRATNLGILYMDSDSNRRWVLRLDDPKQLAEIDAVFVTVEPHGGSQKPTGKPFLYALLRKEANHP